MCENFVESQFTKLNVCQHIVDANSQTIFRQCYMFTVFLTLFMFPINLNDHIGALLPYLLSVYFTWIQNVSILLYINYLVFVFILCALQLHYNNN